MPEDQQKKVRDIQKIAVRYLKTRFLIDLLPQIPFYRWVDGKNSKLFQLIKIMRLSKGIYLLSSNQFMAQIKRVYQKKLENLILTDPDLKDNMDIDNNNIMSILIISYFFKTFKVIAVVLTMSYFIGMFWYIFCELSLRDPPPLGENGEPTENEGFLVEYELKEKTPLENTIIVMYFAFTTLSTVGFGDYAPRSNAERLVFTWVLLGGVAIFSYIMGVFIEILQSIFALTADVQDDESLSRWFGLIKRFNYGRPVSQELKEKIEQYFTYRWTNDKNIAICTEADLKIFDELPPDTQQKLYSEFLFKIFIKNFKKFFEFKKETNAKVPHTYYSWHDVYYQNFMIEMLKQLEPIQIPSRETIHYELDEVNEILFIQRGDYNIGYEINKQEQFRLRLGQHTVIGAFEICFNKRQIFIYRTHSECEGFMIRKAHWKSLMDNFTEFFSIIKKKVLLEHINKIRRPLMDYKQKDIEHYDQRADFQQVLTLKDYEPHELQNLLADELDEKGDASYETKRIEKLESQIERSALKLELQMRTFEKTYE